jgi:sodium transport system ATP-binding protein
MITVNQIQKQFGAVHAVHDASFTVAKGTISTLLGGNGSGKTTTLRCIVGLFATNAGEVRIDGIDPWQAPAQARALIGYFPDRNGLYPRLTPREHWRYFAGLHGQSGKALEARMQALIDTLGMSTLADRPTIGFSAGERMLVALGRALIHAPKVLILDEPSRGLDIENLRRLRRVLQQLRAEGVAILMASHVLAEVDALSDQIIVMARGRVCATGSPAQLKHDHACTDLEQTYLAITGATS